MKQLKLRIPVVCQNGHKALFYYEINNKKLSDIFEYKPVGVPEDQNCSCPKAGYEEGWRRAGDDQMFTGLQDIDGVDAYEGDRIKFLFDHGSGEKYNYRLIEWNENTTGFSPMVDIGVTRFKIIYADYLVKGKTYAKNDK